MANDPIHPEVNNLLHVLKTSLDQNRFVKLILSRYRGRTTDLKKIMVRPVSLKKETQLSFVYSCATQDITKNFPVDEGMENIGELIARDFLYAHLMTLDGDFHLEFGRKEKPRMKQERPTHTATPSTEHNRAKKRQLDPARPFLHALGITDAAHNVIPSMSDKWKQINRFLEIFEEALTTSQLSRQKTIRVVDFGAGKGYLTFAVHDFLTNHLHLQAQVTGIELREELVSFCRDTATRLSCDGLTFLQGDVKHAPPLETDILIALHACDTATDLALHLGIRCHAGILLCAPCCHKQIRPQMKSPATLEPLLRFGVHLAQEAEMVTDSLRALLLEASGYRVKIFEFISLEHTDKNKMILAVADRNKTAPQAALEKAQALKTFYGIQDHRLETLLNESPSTQSPL